MNADTLLEIDHLPLPEASEGCGTTAVHHLGGLLSLCLESVSIFVKYGYIEEPNALNFYSSLQLILSYILRRHQSTALTSAHGLPVCNELLPHKKRSPMPTQLSQMILKESF